MPIIISGCIPRLKPLGHAIKAESRRQLLSSRQACWKRRDIHSLLRANNPGQGFYGTVAKANTNNHLFAYTWLTKAPGSITPDDILSSVPVQIPSDQPQIALLLLTPSFAAWADSNNGFLERCVNKLYNTLDSPRPSPLYVIAAVVDGLPDVSGHTRDTELEPLGLEGISLLHLKQADVLGKATQPRRAKSLGTEQPVLALSIETSNKADGSIRGATHEVGLRLANTLFVNGKEHTLFGSHWVYNHTSRKFERSGSVHLTSCLVKLTANCICNSLEIPLHPVSQRRKVVSCMGNILRQVGKSADSRSTDPMPASSELEKELPLYIAKHGIVDQRVSVWALLEKPDCALPEVNVQKSLQAGGRLLRVISGGGGWGKKQGLLSLDPETCFQEIADAGDLSGLHELIHPADTSPAPISSYLLDKEPATDSLPFLPQIIEPGDYVQFFVSVEPKHVHDRRSNPQEGEIVLNFGIIPDAEGVRADDAEDIHRKNLLTIPNYFGALSEKAITYLQPVGVGSTGKVTEGATKLDVPGSRVELVIV